VPLNGSNTIPADTPSGIYYLGAVIDAGNKFSESNERNNVHFCKIKVIGSVTKRMPDLIIASIDFKKVTQRYDAKKQPYWIFNVIITVKNQGAANAGPFKVLLERNVGPGGSFTQACQTCVIGVQGLGAGQSITLPPRQFNNANNANSKFRVTADIGNTVPESIETNNRKIASF
jgi:subtilase family serine protease